MSPALAHIEAARAQLGIDAARLEAAAGLQGYYYRRLLRGDFAPTPATLARLRTGLARCRARQTDDRAMVLAYRLALALAAHVLGLDPARCQDQDPARRASFSREWMAASEARRLALYLLNAGCGFSQSAVARAAGMTKQAVSLACREIEDRRSDRAFDELADRLTAAIMGEMG
jgi:hypothetical protein